MLGKVNFEKHGIVKVTYHIHLQNLALFPKVKVFKGLIWRISKGREEQLMGLDRLKYITKGII